MVSGVVEMHGSELCVELLCSVILTSKLRIDHCFTTVFNFTRLLAVFHQEKTCVSAAVNHTINGASTKLLLSIKGFCF